MTSQKKWNVKEFEHKTRFKISFSVRLLKLNARNFESAFKKLLELKKYF